MSSKWSKVRAGVRERVNVCVYVCMCACMHACVRVCLRAGGRERVVRGLVVTYVHYLCWGYRHTTIAN